MQDIKIQEHTKDFFTLENFLDVKECENYITLSEKLGYDESELHTENGSIKLYSVRRSHRSDYADLQLAEVFWHRLEPYFIRMIENSEKANSVNHQLRFYKYEQGHYFVKHRDRSVFLKEKKSHYTIIIYLNDNFEGGELKTGNIIMTPKTGMLVCIKHEYLRESLPIKAGTKYVLHSDVMYAKN